MSVKPILFNTDMVRAIYSGAKTATRRAVRPRYCDSVFEMFRDELCEASPYKPPRNNGDGTTTRFVRQYVPCRPPYRPGDILYVRETWRVQSARRFDADARIMFKAGGDMVRVKFPGGGDQYHSRTKYDLFVHKWADDRWHPSIHMPREAARIFLKVTDVRVERLQDSFFKHGSTIFALLKEGIDIGEQCRECIDDYEHPCCIDGESECGILDEVRGKFADLWDRCYAAPRPVKGKGGVIDHYESYPWADINETRTYKGKPWYVIGNPWVWVTEFERVGREEALAWAGGK